MARFIRMYGLGLAAGAMLALLTGCFDFGDKNTTLVNGQTQGGGVTGGSEIPLQQNCAVASLAGGIYGDKGDAACVGRVGNTVPIGCSAFGTITPKMADGNDAPPAVHGQNLTVNVLVGVGLANVSQDDDNLFNYTFTRVAVGEVRFRATLSPTGCNPVTREYVFP